MKIRPQILVAIICATIITCLALYVGYWMEAVEIVTAVTEESSGS